MKLTDGEDGAGAVAGKDGAKPLGKPIGKLKLGAPAGTEKAPGKDTHANANTSAVITDGVPVPEPEKDKDDRPSNAEPGPGKDPNGKVAALAKPTGKLKLGTVGVGATGPDNAKDADAPAEAPETPESLEAT